MSEPTTEGVATAPQMSANDNVNLVQQLLNTGWGGWGERADIAKRMASGLATTPGFGFQALQLADYAAHGVPVDEGPTEMEAMNNVGLAYWMGGAPNAAYVQNAMEPVTEEPVIPGRRGEQIDQSVLDRQTTAHGLTLAGVLAADKAEYDAAIADALTDQNAVLNDQYGDVIDRLKSDLHDFQRGKLDINGLYSRYSEASNKIMSQAVVDAEGLADTDVLERVGRSYDQAEGALNDALVRIDTSESPEMAAAMNAELRFFEGSIESALESDINMGDALHGASSDYAKAVAQAAWSGDIYNAERSRAEIQIQLNGAIAEKQEELARQHDSWAKAKARARADAEEMYGEDWEPERDAMWKATFEKYLEGEGFNSEMILEMSGAFPSMLDKNGHIATVEDWYRAVQEEVNKKNLAALILPDGRTALDLWNGTYELKAQDPDRSGVVAMDQIIKNLDFAYAHESVERFTDSIFGGGHFNIPYDRLGDNAASTQDPYYVALQRLWKWNRDFSNQYDEELEKVKG